MTVLTWITAIAALIGVWLNIRKHVACFWIWVGTNTVWTYADLRHGLPAQAGLQAVYLVLSICGIWRWSRREEA